MGKFLLLLLLITYVSCDSSKESDKSVENEKEYAFYYPLAMGADQLSTVCLAIEQTLLPAKVKVTFENRTCEDCKPHVVESGYSCWEVKVPEKDTDDYYGLTKINVEIETKEKNIKFTGENEVRISREDEHIFVETDRRVYKMGDTVKIRFLVLGYDLKPVKDYKLKDIKIQSPYPARATVAQWDNLSTNLGLAQLEFQLAPDTPEGYWTLTGDRIYKNFEVKKYILPRFQTTVSGPDSVYVNSETVSYKVCAKYSYGRTLKGNALLAAKVNHGYLVDPTSLSQTKPLENGCAKFDILASDLELNKNHTWSLDLSGSVTEQGTEQIESASKYVYITRDPFSSSWNYESRYIKPELPYKGRFSVTNANVPLDSSVFELCYKLDENVTVCSNFTVDSSNNIEFIIPPIKNISEYRNIRIEARNIEHPLQYNPATYLNVWNSTNGNSIKIDSIEEKPQDCGSTLKFQVTYNSGNLKGKKEVEFKYILSSRTEILDVGTIVDKPKRQPLDLNKHANIIGKEQYKELEDNPIDTFNFEVKLGEKVYTEFKLVVYYVIDNEVIADFIRIDVRKCLPNKVEAKWSESELYPGETGSLNIKADSEGLCAISSIDKASGFLGSNRDINTDSVLNSFNRYTYVNRLNCIKPEEPKAPETTDNITITTIRPYVRYYSPSFDAYEAFKDSNIGMISNLKFITKVCQEQPMYHLLRRPIAFATTLSGGSVAVSGQAAGFAGAPAPQSPALEASIPERADATSNTDDRGSAVRSFFPETWLWDLVTVAEDGKVVLDKKLPDSITDWVGNVLCTSSKKGVGISNDIEIKGFKPFFVDVLLPYSIKRNKEVLHLPVPVFNYLNHSLPIRITLEPNKGLVLVEGDDKKSFDMCLGAEDSYTHIYRIKATELGHVNITVSGNVNPAYAENCAPESVIRRRDVVQKPILVEPEGYPSGILKSVLLCANDSSGVDNIAWKLELPENVVADTVVGKVIINSDILGPMFQNLENILVVPTGCGEQTMATLTPNLYVLKYLESNKALSEETQEKILKNLEIGYQRMLNYVHDDGSFSAFGKSDGNGSMFLTAFVIRTFKQMKQYIFIDDDVLNKATNWIIAHQLENGCFDPVHHVFHEMGLASSKNQTTALTSYVLISFLETNTNIDEKILSSAKECILKDEAFDKYTLAISSYALGLLNVSEEAQKKLDKLVELSEHKDDLRWWKQADNSLSANVEISSYVLISLLKQNPVENLGTASSIVRWLQSQMNPRGAFYSTTDTVVGLDAISRYAALVNKKEPNVKVSVKTTESNKDIAITKRDRTKTEIIPLDTYPNDVKANIQGDGCVSIQATVSYYLDKPVTTDDLKLDIKLKPVSEKLKCSLVELKPCVSYNSPGQINMAIVEVGLPSGYAADQASLYELTASKVVKKFEQIKNQIVFYITQLGSNEVCMPFKIEENLIVENIANATVNFYDYYKPEVTISKSFKLEDCEQNTSVSA